VPIGKRSVRSLVVISCLLIEEKEKEKEKEMWLESNRRMNEERQLE